MLKRSLQHPHSIRTISVLRCFVASPFNGEGSATFDTGTSGAESSPACTDRNLKSGAKSLHHTSIISLSSSSITRALHLRLLRKLLLCLTLRHLLGTGLPLIGWCRNPNYLSDMQVIRIYARIRIDNVLYIDIILLCNLV